MIYLVGMRTTLWALYLVSCELCCTVEDIDLVMFYFLATYPPKTIPAIHL
jgi:hypothetical protein